MSTEDLDMPIKWCIRYSHARQKRTIHSDQSWHVISSLQVSHISDGRWVTTLMVWQREGNLARSQLWPSFNPAIAFDNKRFSEPVFNVYFFLNYFPPFILDLPQDQVLAQGQIWPKVRDRPFLDLRVILKTDSESLGRSQVFAWFLLCCQQKDELVQFVQSVLLHHLRPFRVQDLQLNRCLKYPYPLSEPTISPCLLLRIPSKSQTLLTISLKRCLNRSWLPCERPETVDGDTPLTATRSAPERREHESTLGKWFIRAMKRMLFSWSSSHMISIVSFSNFEAFLQVSWIDMMSGGEDTVTDVPSNLFVICQWKWIFSNCSSHITYALFLSPFSFCRAQRDR